MLREAPERSMVTVVALGDQCVGQWRSIDLWVESPKGGVEIFSLQLNSWRLLLSSVKL